MVTQIPVHNNKKSVGSPIYEYESMYRLWKRARAIIDGELAAKKHDSYLDTVSYTNLLVPFHPTMNPNQYRWYVAEAELPGLVSQYSKVLLGGLLRKKPTITIETNEAEEILNWLYNDFTEDNRSIISFLDHAIMEEITTSRGAISIDFPIIENYEGLTVEERASIKPYPIFWKAEEIINWSIGKNLKTGDVVLNRIVFRFIDKDYSDSPYHAKLVPTVMDHYLDDSGIYRVDRYILEGENAVEVFNGQLKMLELGSAASFLEGEKAWVKAGETMTPVMSGEPLTHVPVYFFNGESELETPILTPLIDREINLYNKISRRNHLLYGAATFTPILKSDMLDEEEFHKIVSAGLGSWIKIGQNDSIDSLSVPTDALADYDRAIEASVSELSRMGIRMLTPEGAGGESGIALEIRNAPQTAQIGVLNTKLSQTMKLVIKDMILWRYGKDYDVSSLDFELSADFNPSPLGAEWMKLVTEWYQSRIIPRSVFIKVAKHHDILPADYNDEEAIEEISQDTLTGEATSMEITEEE